MKEIIAYLTQPGLKWIVFFQLQVLMEKSPSDYEEICSMRMDFREMTSICGRYEFGSAVN